MRRLLNKARDRHLLAAIVLYVLGVAVYSNTFTSPFIFDDFPNIEDNPAITLETLSLEGLYQAFLENGSWRRPVAYLSFALNYRLSGLDVRGFHLVNVFIHVFNGFVVYVLAMLLLGHRFNLPRTDAHTLTFAALAGACVFVVHPLQTQAVTYIVQRMTSLCTLFYLLAVLCYVCSRLDSVNGRWRYRIPAIGFGALALGTKEIAATLPLALVLIEWCFFQHARSDWLRAGGRYVLLAFVTFAVIGLVYLGFEPVSGITEQYQDRAFSITERLLTESRVLMFYLSLVAYPDPGRLNLLHDIAVSTDLVTPITTLSSTAAIICVVLVGIAGVGRWPLVLFGCAWFLLTSMVESTVVGLELVYEHRMYLPMFGLCLLVCAICLKSALRSTVTWVVVIGLVGYLGVGTYLRNAIWADEVTLWVDVVTKSPDSARARNNLGCALLAQNLSAQAVIQLNQALFLDDDYAEPHNNLGVYYASQGQFEIAMGHFSQAVRIAPDSPSVRHNLGMALAETGRIADAIVEFSNAIRIKPDYAKAHIGLARLLADSGDHVRACEHLHAAARTIPESRIKSALEHCPE